VTTSPRITAADFADRAESDPRVQVVDVRGEGEVAVTGTVPRATPIPLTRLADRASELDPARPVVVYCAGGYRSMIASSLLASLGFTDVSDLLGGYAAWATQERLS